MRSLHQRLRPLSITDILDEAIDLYKSNFVLLVGIAAIVYVPLFMISGFLENKSLTNTIDTKAIVNWLVTAVISSIVTAALTSAISERYLGRETTIKGSYRRVLNPLVIKSLMGAVLLKCLIVFVPIVTTAAIFLRVGQDMMRSANPAQSVVLVLSLLPLMLVAMVWLVFGGLRFALVEPVVVLDSKSSLKSLGRSWKLMSGSMGKALLLYLIVFAVVVIMTLIITGPTSGIIAMKILRGAQIPHFLIVIDTLLSTIIQTLTAPFVSIVAILLYYDIRIRKEGFDLELLASDLDQKAQEIRAGAYNALPQEQVAPQEYSSEQNSKSGDQA